MINLVVVQGRLASDAETRQLPSGTQVVRFTLANTEYLGGGERRTNWIDVSAWERSISKILQYLKKGKEVTVVGSLRQRDWIDKAGNKRRGFEVIANDVRLGGARREEEQQQPTSTPATTAWDDVPF